MNAKVNGLINLIREEYNTNLGKWDKDRMEVAQVTKLHNYVIEHFGESKEPRPENEQAYYVISTYLEGEGCCHWEEISEDSVRALVGDNFEELTCDNAIEIRKVTPEQKLNSLLNGAAMDGCYEKAEQIRYYMDEGDLLEGPLSEVAIQLYPTEYATAKNAGSLENMQEGQ